jgi:hypothetical protein
MWSLTLEGIITEMQKHPAQGLPYFPRGSLCQTDGALDWSGRKEGCQDAVFLEGGKVVHRAPAQGAGAERTPAAGQVPGTRVYSVHRMGVS